jgi:glycosyltransferase involved in cell wall biosynthesis
MTLAEDLVETVEQAGPPDVVVVSDMVDVAALVGFARSAVGSAPVAAYFHESQLLYPTASGMAPRHEDVLANWRSMAAADLVLFNSHFHHDRLLEGLPGFLADVADDRHVARMADVTGRCEVLPVGVDLSQLSVDDRATPDQVPPLVLWSHRWEPDKQVEQALRLLVDLAREGQDFRLAFVGEQPDPLPTPVAALTSELTDVLGHRLVALGHVPRQGYVDLLLQADIVLSTATHEFFGIAVVEALAAGCVPVLPRAQSYPEIVPERWHSAALHDPGAAGPRDHLRAVLADLASARQAVEGLAEETRRFDWSVMAPAYDDRLARLGSTGR